MVTIRQQLQRAEQRPVLTRTERRIEAQRRELRAPTVSGEQVNQALERLSQAETVEEYGQIYSELSPELQRAVPPPSQIARTETERKAQVRSQVDEEIERKQDIIERLRARQATASGEKARELETEVAFTEWLIEGLETGRGHIERGATFEAIRGFAGDRAEARLARKRGRERSITEYFKETGIAITPQQLQAIRRRARMPTVEKGRRISVPPVLDFPEGFAGISTPEGVMVVEVGTGRIFKPFQSAKEGVIFKAEAPPTLPFLTAPTIQVPVSVLDVPATPIGFFPKVERRIKEFSSKVPTKEMRGEEVSKKEILGYAPSKLVLPFVETAAFLESTSRTAITKPKETFEKIMATTSEAVGDPIATGKKIGAGISEAGKGVGIMLREEPVGATARIFGELAFLRGTQLVFVKGTPLVGAAITRVSPKFKPVVSGKITVPSGMPEREFLEIKIAPPVSKLKTPLPEQVRLAGTVQDVASAQKNLFSTLRREITIEKPKPTGAPELERALFGDPLGRLRVSRLGLEQKEAGISDLLFGDVAFRRTKPQAIIFEKERIAKFPAGLKDVERALLEGKPLTPSQQKRFLEFQLTPTGQFKPIGFLSKEPEVTLSPQEIIKRQETLAQTVIMGRRVPIISAEIGKPTKETSKLLEEALQGKIGQKDIINLEKRLKKETGFDISVSGEVKPFVSLAAPSLPSGISRQARLKNILMSISKQNKKLESSVSALSKEPIQKVLARISAPSPTAPSKAGVVGISKPSAPSKISGKPIIPRFFQPALTRPIFKPPITTVGLPLPDIELDIKKILEENLKKQKEIFAFFPDFTTKMLGLKPLEVSEKEGLKLVQKILTGLELRRGAVVKGRRRK